MEGVTVVVESAPWWETLVPQVLGTLVGAGVALAGSWWLFTRERQEQYEDVIDNAIGRVLEEGALFTAARSRYLSLSFRWNLARMLPGSRSEAGPTPEEPDMTAWLVRVREASLRAKGNDRPVLDLASVAAERISVAPAEHRSSLVEDVGGTLYRWRRGLIDVSATEKSLLEAKKFAEDATAREIEAVAREFSDSPPAAGE